MDRWGQGLQGWILGLAGDESLYDMKISSCSVPCECSNIPGHSHLPVLNIKETAHPHINHTSQIFSQSRIVLNDKKDIYMPS